MKDTINKIYDIDTSITLKYDLKQKPKGARWLYVVLDIAEKILDEIPLEELTPDVLDQLTDQNYHTARHAAEILLHLNNYTLPETPLF